MANKRHDGDQRRAVQGGWKRSVEAEVRLRAQPMIDRSRVALRGRREPGDNAAAGAGARALKHADCAAWLDAHRRVGRRDGCRVDDSDMAEEGAASSVASAQYRIFC